MAKSDSLIEIIKYALNDDKNKLRKSVEALCAEEREKQHLVVANKIENILINSKINKNTREVAFINNRIMNSENLFIEKIPKRDINNIILSNENRNICDEFIEEQNRSELLRSYGLEPRNKILLIGPPGNGKTSLAEAIAESLSLPLYTVKYESIVGSYLGETASRLSSLIEYVKTRQCVLFFDEFETLGKERGDIHETGEIKRVVSSLLLSIDSLPSYVIVIAATNHDDLIDRAAWRRFQIKMKLDKPQIREVEKTLRLFEKRMNFKFNYSINRIAKSLLGYNFSEVEEFSMNVYRKYILNIPNNDLKKIIENEIAYFEKRKNSISGEMNNG
jgi:SpoVK/Ycf46/Vps4 family AAA+-type ATPase